ncbi:hypothetical protein I5Q34_24710 [Streptomyces sp. AV19]|uniref:hypothetical protein n=1 Tax=Streptomyces sp. AV19 TaxID=2793068 RepID=UPI0018FE1EDE|nr:hypothetical protein [Streptomyces sp. AV19]MBH1937431.1 hypothetical protein [Streptomyces sp. AV19]MDG4533796.1 hypothetical protein [Streptomyces sp. AV19]
MTSATESADHVSVHLTGCDERAADAVIAALDAAFPAGAGAPVREAAPPGPSRAGGQPVIWCTEVDTKARRAARGPSPAALGGPVTADLFGAADPVHQVKEELAAAFGVEEHGTVPGEHELEVRLVLTPLDKPSK